ncbi:hypothetical protein NHX12_033863 [Muraenolepis orangiensis]|uniref:Uncharacterized protein n=1 Tax=Muraenolepis orangiensis TaxID=630683 RepID=A0A9Q0E4J0_9TELE|nr:hypothetical protein NHX12_033863 [Muraenolepis orangiensis]
MKGRRPEGEVPRAGAGRKAATGRESSRDEASLSRDVEDGAAEGARRVEPAAGERRRETAGRRGARRPERPEDAERDCRGKAGGGAREREEK